MENEYTVSVPSEGLSSDEKNYNVCGRCFEDSRKSRKGYGVDELEERIAP
jgi:hypothetical protein